MRSSIQVVAELGSIYVCVSPDRLEVFDCGIHAIAELERIPDGAGKIASSDRKRRGRYDLTLSAITSAPPPSSIA